jgi:hypothetical protein
MVTAQPNNASRAVSGATEERSELASKRTPASPEGSQ